MCVCVRVGGYNCRRDQTESVHDEDAELERVREDDNGKATVTLPTTFTQELISLEQFDKVRS